MKKKGLKAVQTQSLVELAHTQLLESITSGHFDENDRIVIDTVAEELGISRIPVREALARLHAQKLLEYERNKGYKVLPKEDYAVLFQARLIIEPSAIRYCNKEIMDKDIHKLREINHKISKLLQRKKSRQYMDFFVLNAFIESVKRKTNPPIDVYDAATWMAITPLSEQSIATGSQAMPFPDFTKGKWMKNKNEFALNDDF